MRRSAVWLSLTAGFLAVVLLCLFWNAAWLDEFVGVPRAMAAAPVCRPPSFVSMTREGHTIFLGGRLAGEEEHRRVTEAIRSGLATGDAVVDGVGVGGVTDDGVSTRAAGLWPLFRENGIHMRLGRDSSFFLGRAEDEVAKASVAARFNEATRPQDVGVSVAVDPSLAVEKAQRALDALTQGATIDFEVASTIIQRPSLKVLDGVALRLLQHPRVKVRIIGHTDGLGDRYGNRVLSLARANAVRSYVASRGVAPARMTAEGFGAERPVASNDSPEGRRQNRRIEFVVYREAGP